MAIKDRANKLSDYFWFQEGPGVRKWQFTNEGIKLINVANLDKRGFLDLTKTDRHLSLDEVENKYSHFLIDDGDLVIASSGITIDDDGLLRTRGAFVKKEHLPLCLNTSTIRFKAIEGKSDLRYLRHWINSREFRSQITKLVTGSAQKNFGPSHLKQLEISCPSLKEQKRIADLLDKAQEIQSKRRQAIEKINSLSQAIFLVMFGDPFSNNKKWPLVRFGDMASKFSDGPFGSNLKSEHYVENGVRVIRLQNIGVNEFIDLDKAYVSEDHFQKIKKHECRPGDVIVGTMGEPNLRACILPSSNPLAINKADCVQIRPNQSIANASYICALLNSPSALKMAESNMQGQTRIRISMGRLREMIFPLPPIELQREFESRVEFVSSLTKKIKLAEFRDSELVNSLQQKCFGGTY